MCQGVHLAVSAREEPGVPCDNNVRAHLRRAYHHQQPPLCGAPSHRRLWPQVLQVFFYFFY